MRTSAQLRTLMMMGAASVWLTGCGPLISFGDEGPADTVYTLRYDGDYDRGGSGPVVYVDEPTMTDGLKGEKVAVSLDGGKRLAIDGVRWSAPISELVRNYITRALGHKTPAQVMGEWGLDARAACRLGVNVWAFEYSPGARAADDTVEVAVELSLVRLKDSQLIGKPTFVETVAVNGAGGEAVMDAFSKAMATATDDMTQWFSGKYQECATG